MTAKTVITCDGPACKREIDSITHAGTWITLMYGRVFGEGIGDQYKLKADRHFCSMFCLFAYVKNTYSSELSSLYKPSPGADPLENLF